MADAHGRPRSHDNSSLSRGRQCLMSTWSGQGRSSAPFPLVSSARPRSGCRKPERAGRQPSGAARPDRPEPSAAVSFPLDEALVGSRSGHEPGHPGSALLRLLHPDRTDRPPGRTRPSAAQVPQAAGELLAHAGRSAHAAGEVRAAVQGTPSASAASARAAPHRRVPAVAFSRVRPHRRFTPLCADAPSSGTRGRADGALRGKTDRKGASSPRCAVNASTTRTWCGLRGHAALPAGTASSGNVRAGPSGAGMGGVRGRRAKRNRTARTRRAPRRHSLLRGCSRRLEWSKYGVRSRGFAPKTIGRWDELRRRVRSS
jgi:hypothetical protein